MWTWMLAGALAAPTVAEIASSTAEGDQTTLELFLGCRAGTEIPLSGWVEPTGEVDGLVVTALGPVGPVDAPFAWRARVERAPTVTGTTWGLVAAVVCVDAASNARLSRVMTTGAQPGGVAQLSTVTAQCPAGTRPISGGTVIDGVSGGRGISQSHPAQQTGWVGSVVALDTTRPPFGNATVEVSAVCVPERTYQRFFQQVTARTPANGIGASQTRCPGDGQRIAGGGRVKPDLPGVQAVVGVVLGSVGGFPRWRVGAQELVPYPSAWSIDATAICLTR